MKGTPVWFLPYVLPYINKSTIDTSLAVMDLKLSPQGTLTFMNNTGIFEINYNGDVLWSSKDLNKGNKDGNFNKYHHEFTRLSNGHYMVLGMQNVLYKKPLLSENSFLSDTSNSFFTTNDTNYGKVKLGTMIEYNAKGEVVWEWRSSKYFQESDLFNAFKHGIIHPDLHENAFFFDEKNKTVYISFRNISRVIKVKYPEGNVLNTYGRIYTNRDTPGVTDFGNDFFCAQHYCMLSEKGYLYLYNNNNCKGDGIPSIVMMQEPRSPGDTLKKIWEYKCTLMQDDGVIEPTRVGNGAGNVFELPDGSIFASTGYYPGETFIVNRNKEILWSALPEIWNPDWTKWEHMANHRPSYSVHIINKKELERLIWSFGVAQDDK